MLIYNCEFILRQSDFDCNDNIKPSAILDLFQSVAADHATQLGFGFDPMKEKGLAWVIVKTKFDILKPLKASERIKVETLPHPKGLVDYTRDYFIYGEEGSLAVIGTSQWVLIDFATRKIARATTDFNGEFVNKFAYEDKRIEKVAPFNGDSAYTHAVSVVDLDHNGHVNNIRYADMMLCADGKRDDSSVKSFVINFSNEAKWGDTIEVCVKEENGVTFYSGNLGSVNCFTAKVTR